MGYYSQVSILMDNDSVDKFMGQVKEKLPQYLGWFEQALQNGDKKFCIKDKPYKIFYFDDVKWYDNFPEVQIVDDFLRYFEEPSFCDYLVIGEDYDDVEHSWNTIPYFSIDRSIRLAE